MTRHYNEPVKLFPTPPEPVDRAMCREFLNQLRQMDAGKQPGAMTNTTPTTPSMKTATYEVTIQRVSAAEESVDRNTTATVVPDDNLEFSTRISADISSLTSQEFLRWLMNTAIRQLFDGNASFSVGHTSQHGFNEQTFEATILANVFVTYPLGVLVPGKCASNSHRLPGCFLFRVKPEMSETLAAKWLSLGK